MFHYLGGPKFQITTECITFYSNLICASSAVLLFKRVSWGRSETVIGRYREEGDGKWRREDGWRTTGQSVNGSRKRAEEILGYWTGWLSLHSEGVKEAFAGAALLALKVLTTSTPLQSSHVLHSQRGFPFKVKDDVKLTYLLCQWRLRKLSCRCTQ